MNDIKRPKAANPAAGDPDRKDMLGGRKGGGDSGGGAYPNPHSGKEGRGGKEGFLGDGGQTEKGYHGEGRLGEDETGENPNSAASR